MTVDRLAECSHSQRPRPHARASQAPLAHVMPTTTTNSPPSFPVRCVAADTDAIPAGSSSDASPRQTPTPPAPPQPTRILAASFGDVEWVAVSQTGALGCLVRAVPAAAGRGPGGASGLSLGMEEEGGVEADPLLAPHVATLSGRRDDPATAALARLLLARLAASGAGTKPLLLSCALQDASPAAVRAAADAVVAVWEGR